MSPREIEVHIEELVLHGFEPGNRWRIGNALEDELRGLLAADDIPPTWLSNPERIDGGTICSSGVAKPGEVGGQIAKAAYRGRSK
jgi:hypothetical protein